MPLVRARCDACTLPLGDAPYTPVAARCGRCGLQTVVQVASDGQPSEFDAAFSPPRLLAWFAAARAAMAGGMPGVAVGACPACQSPLVLSSREPIELPCPHCREPVRGTTADVLVDQWPEPWCKVEGGGLELEFRISLIDDTTGITAGCAACGLATPSNDPGLRCKRCGAVVWVERPVPGAEAGDKTTKRMQLGVRVNGMRHGRPFNVLIPVVQGEMMLRADAAIGTSSQSGSSALGVTGVGCAIVVAVVALAIGGIAMAVHFSHC